MTKEEQAAADRQAAIDKANAQKAKIDADTRERERAAAEKEEKALIAGKEAPPQNPAMGDKDPVYVEWYKKHHTAAEFEAKYGNRSGGVLDEARA